MRREPVSAALQQQLQRKDQLSPSEKVGVECTPEEDRARQEFKRETETSYLLAKFGAGQAFPAAPGSSGHFEQDMDLQTAYRVVQESKSAWLRLPPDVREKYGSWIQLQEAVERGEYPPKPVEAPAVVAGGSAGSPSVSAAGEGSRPDKGS